VPSTFNYRITVEIETPESVKSGSAVRQISVRRQPRLPDAGSISYNVSGEAVVIDLGERGVLFSLISHGSYYDVFHAFPYEERGMDAVRYYRSLSAGKKE